MKKGGGGTGNDKVEKNRIRSDLDGISRAAVVSPCVGGYDSLAQQSTIIRSGRTVSTPEGAEPASSVVFHSNPVLFRDHSKV